MLLVGALARGKDCVAERVARSELIKESRGKGAGSLVVDRPASGDDAAHAHFDQLAGKWLSVAYEFLGKINKSNSSQQESFVYAERFSFAIAGVYKALYQDYFRNIYKITHEIQVLLPYHQHIISLIESLLTLRDIKMIRRLSMELWLTTKQYAKSRNIKIESCTENQLNTLLKTL